MLGVCPAVQPSPSLSPKERSMNQQSCLNIWDFKLGCQWGHHEYPKDDPAQPYQQLSQPVAKMLKKPTDIYICVYEICLLGKLALLFLKKKDINLGTASCGLFFPHWFLHIPEPEGTASHPVLPGFHIYSTCPSRVLAPAPSSQGKPLCDGLISKKLVNFLGGPPSMVLIST